MSATTGPATITDAIGPAPAIPLSFGAALRASTLPPLVRLVLWTCADIADTADDSRQVFTLSLVEIADATGMELAHVARCIADLIATGWIARTDAGHWLPTVPAPRSGP